VAVNKVGSIFYGTMLAIFLIALYAKHVGGKAMLFAAFLAELAVLLCARYTDMAWLWWNVVGCVVGVIAALAIQALLPREEELPITEA
jgi:solute:Na+ symporter, SSS family